MIQAESISKNYDGDTVLDDISFVMNRGERCGLVGRNGSGKTTLLRIVTGQETADGGKLHLPKGYRLGYLDQHIRFTKSTILEEACLGLPEDERDQEYRAERILFGLGFKEKDLDQPPSSFSGGYQLRIHLTKVFLSEPDVLLLDEPTNYLDVVSIRWLSRFLKTWKGELLLVSHDREFMDQVCTHILGIHRQKMAKVKGNTEAFYAQVVLQEESHMRQLEKSDKKRAKAEDYIRRFGAKASKAKQAQSRAKALEKMPSIEKLVQIDNLSFNFNEASFPGRKILEASDISFAYSGMESLIDDFNLTLEKGERLAIIGKNGRGKSTLLRLLAADLNPDSGACEISSNAKIGLFGQTNIDRLNPSHTVEEEVSSADPYLDRTQVRGICGQMMFSGDKAEKAIRVLSGGERSRVLLGKILATPCNLLLLDEPTHHLDMESVEALIEALENFDGAVIIVTHSEMILRRVPSKLIVCHENRQSLFLGSYDEFLKKEGWEDSDSTGVKKSSKGRKQQKQERAKLVQQRSEKLRPLKKKMEQLEKQITKLEADLNLEQEKLLKVSQEEDQELIADLSRKIGEKSKAINTSYLSLEQVSNEHDTEFAKYDKRLQELE